MPEILNKGIKYTIANILKEDADGIEIEVRIRKPFPQESLQNLEDFLKESGYKLIESNTVDYIDGAHRYTYDGKDFYETSKTQLLTKYENTYNLKINVAREEKNKTTKPDKYNMIREKNRRSYQKDNISIDITDTLEKDLIKDQETKRTEIELEVIDPRLFNFDKLNQSLEMVTNMLFVDSDIIEDFTAAMGKKSNSLKDVYRLLSKPRDLKFADLTYDGILQPFAVSIKASGVNVCLYFHKSGIFIFYITKDNKYERISSLPKEFQTLENTLYVGELLDKSALKKMIVSPYLFLPYDCLQYQGQIIRNEKYTFRHDKCSALYDKKILRDGKFYLTVQEKPIITYQDSTDSFNEAVIESFRRADKLNYESDGLVFTPIMSPYIAKGQGVRDLRKRVLKDYLDVCKFKKKDDLTIDLLVKKDGLYTSKGKFVGTSRYPLQKDDFVIKKEYYDKIIEFKPEEIDGKLVYTFYLDRTENKPAPNNPNVAETLWELRKNPIEVTTLEGKDVVLLRKYHNQIKSRLIEKQSGYVLDLGSGKGGDLPKYKKNKSIKNCLFLEPNTEFIEEFKSRRDNLDLSYEIIQGGAEETAKILKKCKSYFPDNFGDNNFNINLMISLSFFWKSEEMLDNLAQTILQVQKFYLERQGTGRVLMNFLTIEGQRLESLFQERGDDIDLGYITLGKKGENEVYVDIKGSQTVDKQTEYLVKLDQLWKKIDFNPLYLKETMNDQPGDFILTANEKTYTSLFVYGQAAKNACLYVNEDMGVEGPNGVQAEGDDALSSLGDKLYRMAVLKNNGSLYHSVMKLITEKYRNEDYHGRTRIAHALSEKVNFTTDLEVLSKLINKGIVLIKNDQKTKYGKDKKQWIFLYQCEENLFEPVIYKDDRVHFVFNEDSFLLDF